MNCYNYCYIASGVFCLWQVQYYLHNHLISILGIMIFTDLVILFSIEI